MNLESNPLRCWVEIDPSALRHNLAVVRAQVGARVKVMAVVKANAYGHDAALAVKALAGDADMFGVANLTEAQEVRKWAPHTPVLILGPGLPDERAGIASERFIPIISTLDEARAFHSLAGETPLEAHLMIDTGMGRTGAWENDALTLAGELRGLSGLRITGLSSHLPSADEDEEFTKAQLDRFQKVVLQIRTLGYQDALVHIENSAGIIGFPSEAGDLVRAGLMLYGCAPIREFQPRLRPAMTWKTRITLLRTAPAGHGVSYGRTYVTSRPTRIATLAVGYADGYQRHLTNSGAEVLIRGQRCSVLGRVTMDQIVVNVDDLPEVAAGDEVVLMGRQDGQEILAAELAQKAGTIPWEIFTGVGRRVQRVCI